MRTARTRIAASMAGLSAVAVLASGLAAPLAHSTGPGRRSPEPAGAARPADPVLPVRFEANEGQADSRATFVARGGSSTLFLTAGGAVVDLHQPGSGHRAALQLRLEGAAPTVPTGTGALGAVTNHLHGNEPARWHAGVPTFAGATYHQVLPGVDWVFYGHGGDLEYDLVVHPGADPGALTVAVDGADGLSVEAGGELVVRSAAGELRNGRPRLYQDVNGHRRPVAGRYELRGPGRVGFVVGPYDRALPLVIDPILSYSFTVGGAGVDVVNDLAVDGAGNTYVTGTTDSSDLPTTTGAYDRTLAANGTDAFVAKLNPAGTALVWATYLGGAQNTSQGMVPNDRGRGVAVDGSGNVYVTGGTKSLDFPVTPSAYQSTLTCGTGPDVCDEEVFLTELNSTGSALVYSSYLGDVGGDYGMDVALGPPPGGGTGVRAYVGGVVGNNSRTFDVTLGSSQTARPCLQTFGQCFYPVGFVSIFDTSSSGPTSLQASTLLEDISSAAGGVTISGIAVDPSGNAYVTGGTNVADFPTTPGSYDTTCGTDAGGTCNRTGGVNYQDAFVTKFNPTLSARLYSTYVGGSTDEFAHDIVLDASNNAYVTGSTTSTDFPTLNAYDSSCGTIGDCNPFNEANPNDPPSYVPAEDVFVTKLNAAGSALVYSTYLGGSGKDVGEDIALAPGDQAVVTGSTTSTDLALTASPVATGGGAFVARLRGSGAGLALSTYLGAAYDKGTGVAQVGVTTYVGGVRGTNGFVSKLTSPLLPAPADFDGAGTTDVSVFRASGGAWFVKGGNPDAVQWGISSDIPVPADYDGNGSADVAVFRPSSGAWYFWGGAASSWGVSSDIPVPADYDGDGKADIAVFRPAAGTWYVRSGVTMGWGASGDIPVPADYDGDGKADIAVFRPSNGAWYVHRSSGGDTVVPYGVGTDIPVPGDYDADGKADVAVYRPSSGTWYLHLSGGGDTAINYGLPTDQVNPGDYDGDGRTDVAVFRPASGAWYVHNLATGADTAANYGITGDVPLVLPYAIRRFYY